MAQKCPKKRYSFNKFACALKIVIKIKGENVAYIGTPRRDRCVTGNAGKATEGRRSASKQSNVRDERPHAVVSTWKNVYI